MSLEQAGLSLCIQGTSLAQTYQKLKNRFIPVYTGNINLPLSIFYSITVYPCVYREHFVLSSITRSPFGLSLCIQGTY